jgi:hypothetical protein
MAAIAVVRIVAFGRLRTDASSIDRDHPWAAGDTDPSGGPRLRGYG